MDSSVKTVLAVLGLVACLIAAWFFWMKAGSPMEINFPSSAQVDGHGAPCEADADCAPLVAPKVAVCNNFGGQDRGTCVVCTDNDGDGAYCEPERQYCCDGLDNDGNGLVDKMDSPCKEHVCPSHASSGRQPE